MRLPGVGERRRAGRPGSSLALALEQHLEGAAHELRVDQLVDGPAFAAGLARSALDDLGDFGFAELEKVMLLVSEQKGVQPHGAAGLDQGGELDMGGEILLAEVLVGIGGPRVPMITLQMAL
jgi:hypothetical protein